MNFTELKFRILNRFRKPPLLGLDLGESGAKLVRIEQGKDGIRLERFYYPHRVNETDPSSVSRFRNFIKSHQMSGMMAACSVGDASLKMRRLDVPKMPDYDLKEAVKWQLRDVAEESIDHYAIRYSILDEYQTGETQRLALMVYCVRRDAIRALMSLLKKVHLRAVLLEPSSVALLSCLDRMVQWEHGSLFGLVDLGESQSSFYAVGEGKLYFSRPLTDISGQKLSQSMMGELGFGEKDFRSLKEGLYTEDEAVLRALGEKLRVVKAFLPLYYSKMAIEVQRSLDALSIMYHRSKVDHVILCGGLSGLPDLKEYLAKNVGIRTERLNPFEGWTVEKDHSYLYSVATGLALYQV